MALAAALVFKCRAENGVPDGGLLRPALATIAAASRLEVARIAAYAALGAPEVYAYLWLAAPHEWDLASLPDYGGCIAGMPAVACALQRVDQRAGASHGADAPFHYVVEFDIESGYESQIDEWYQHEHLGGLAAVPGTVRAQRFFNLGAGPRSFACYDLVTLATHDSPPWFAVRSSDWSSRVRPHFLNPKRTKFRRLFDVEVG
jgi:hypothetical protein